MATCCLLALEVICCQPAVDNVSLVMSMCKHANFVFQSSNCCCLPISAPHTWLHLLVVTALTTTLTSNVFEEMWTSEKVWGQGRDGLWTMYVQHPQATATYISLHVHVVYIFVCKFTESVWVHLQCCNKINALLAFEQPSLWAISLNTTCIEIRMWLVDVGYGSSWTHPIPTCPHIFFTSSSLDFLNFIKNFHVLVFSFLMAFSHFKLFELPSLASTLSSYIFTQFCVFSIPLQVHTQNQRARWKPQLHLTEQPESVVRFCSGPQRFSILHETKLTRLAAYIANWWHDSRCMGAEVSTLHTLTPKSGVQRHNHHLSICHMCSSL